MPPHSSKTQLLRCALLILGLILLPAVPKAQPLQDRIRLYDTGGGVVDRFHDVYQTVCGDYLLCGKSANRDWVKRVDNAGNPIWDVFFMGDRFYSIIEADNGDAVATGARNGFAAVRIDQDGEIVWEQNYGSGAGQTNIELKEGGFILGGSGIDQAETRGELIRIDDEGAVIWRRFFELGRIQAMRETDEGIVTAGYSMIDDLSHGWIQKVSFDGDVVWSHSYLFGEGNSALNFWSLVSLWEGGFAAGGTSSGFIIHKITDAGETITQQRLRIDQNNLMLYCIDKLSDDGLVCVGVLRSQGGNRNNPFIARTDPNLNLIWTEDFHENVGENDPPQGSGINELQEVIVQESDVIVACGSLYNIGQNVRSDDGLLIRYEPDNLTPVIFYRYPEDSLQTVLRSDTLRFIVRARDRDGNELQYAWTRGDSVFGAGDTTVILSFDQVGRENVHCTISNEEYSVETGWIITVLELYIASYSPDSLALSLRRGSSQTFSLDTVRAVDGDPVQYQWTLTNLDNFEREDAGTESRTTVEFLRSGNFQMEGMAYRGESSDNVIWTIAVRSAILDFWPRSLRLFVPPDSSGEFGVIPFNPESDSLSYRWEVDGDSVESDSTVTLRFAWRGFPNPPYTVSAIVMDGMEGDTVRWEVTVREPDEVGKWASGQVDKWGMLSVSPNPFNSTAVIRCSTSGDAYPTRLTIHDLTGREVIRLVDERAQQSPPSRGGPYAVMFDGRELPAGVYLVHLDSGVIRQTVKVVLVR